MAFKMLETARTIYQLKYNKILSPANYTYDIDVEKGIVKALYFIAEKESVPFSKTTGDQLFKHFLEEI